MIKRTDTIFAVATPLGKSAIAVIRISGINCLEILKKISKNIPKEQNRATLNTIVTAKKEIIDRTITTIFKEPKSYTGEDMCEISLHGSHAIIDKLINELNQFSECRMAEPGEFTRRAFENNKFDLTQIEAISDLVNSETEQQRMQAINQLGGVLSDQTNIWSKKIVKILADIEAAIDFTDEELPVNIISDSKEQIVNIINNINHNLNDKGVGEKIRSGFIVAILGKPNVGKSTFFNYIAKREAAIVTKEPGTTRDALELFTEFRGYPVKIFDTAGIRNSNNIAENMGIKKTLEISEKSDINLVFIDNDNDIDTFSKTNNKIFVQSKIDINEKIISKNKIYYISSVSGDGMSALFDKIENLILPKGNIVNISISRERHRKILKTTAKILKNSLIPKNIDLFAEDIRQANNEISKITGKKDVEDILDIIFTDFCIGK